MEWILGMRATWEGLRIDPCPFPSMGAVRATRVWRGRRVTVSFDAAAFAPGAAPTLAANGETLAGCVLDEATLDRLGGEVEIRVSWEGEPGPAVTAEIKMPTTERSEA